MLIMDDQAFAVPSSVSDRDQLVPEYEQATQIPAIPFSARPAESSSDDREAIPSSNPQHRKRLACSGCRQGKIRCNVSNVSSGPCTRCQRMSLDCQVDATFKRVNKRSKAVNARSPSEQNLGSCASRTSSTSAPGRHDGISNNSRNNGHSGMRGNMPLQVLDMDSVSMSQAVERNSEAVQLNSPQKLFPQYSMSIQSPHRSLSSSQRNSCSQTIEHLCLDSMQINELFKIFVNHYHPYLPILDATINPYCYYAYSPLLFWVIISVATRHYKRDPVLITTLAAPVMRLVWENVSTPPHKKYLVQAVLLLCVWPFPSSNMSLDLSFVMLSMAKAVTMQLGLHRPESVQDFLRRKTKLSVEGLEESVRIWSGCYVVAQSLTMSIGQQSFIAMDWVIDRACEENSIYGLPDEMRHKLRIQRFSCHTSQVMSDNRSTPTGLPGENEIGTILKILEREFEILSQELEGKISPINQIMLSSTSLQLRTFYFFEKLENRHRGLLLSYKTALDLIHLVQNATTDFSFMSYAPAHFGHILFLAGTVLLKLLHCKLSQYVDLDMGKQAFNMAVTLLRAASVENNDLNGRSSKILAQLWTMSSSTVSRTGEEYEPTIRLRSRSSASVMHDALWNWRERFGGQESPTPVYTPELFPREESTTINTMERHEELGNGFAIDSNFEDAGSMWDINFPSLLPIDLDAYNF